MKAWLVVKWEAEMESDNGPYWEDCALAVKLEGDGEKILRAAVDEIFGEVREVYITQARMAITLDEPDLTAVLKVRCQERLRERAVKREVDEAKRKRAADEKTAEWLRARIAALESGEPLCKLREQLAALEGGAP